MCDSSPALSALKDAEYWSGVDKALNVYEARATLRELHVTILERSLQKLEQKREALRRAKAAEAEAHAGTSASHHDSLQSLQTSGLSELFDCSPLIFCQCLFIYCNALILRPSRSCACHGDCVCIEFHFALFLRRHLHYGAISCRWCERGRGRSRLSHRC